MWIVRSTSPSLQQVVLQRGGHRLIFSDPPGGILQILPSYPKDVIGGMSLQPGSVTLLYPKMQIKLLFYPEFPFSCLLYQKALNVSSHPYTPGLQLLPQTSWSQMSVKKIKIDHV